MDNQNVGQNLTSPLAQPKPKRWYMHKGILWIITLAIIAVGVSYISLRKPDDKLISLNTTSQNGLKSYKNGTYAVQFQYPEKFRLENYDNTVTFWEDKKILTAVLAMTA